MGFSVPVRSVILDSQWVLPSWLIHDSFVDQENATNSYYEKLASSMEHTGFIYPIIVYTGWMPDERYQYWTLAHRNYALWKAGINTVVDCGYGNAVRNPLIHLGLIHQIMDQPREAILFCHGHGGARLWVAQRAGYRVHALVVDRANLFPESYQIAGEDELLSYLHPGVLGVFLDEKGSLQFINDGERLNPEKAFFLYRERPNA